MVNIRSTLSSKKVPNFSSSWGVSASPPFHSPPLQSFLEFLWFLHRPIRKSKKPQKTLKWWRMKRWGSTLSSKKLPNFSSSSWGVSASPPFHSPPLQSFLELLWFVHRPVSKPKKLQKTLKWWRMKKWGSRNTPRRIGKIGEFFRLKCASPKILFWIYKLSF